MQWHHDALQRLRDRLLDDLCVQIAAAARPIEAHGMDTGDGATEESDRILALNLLSGDRDALQEVESALRRIRDGTYGICEKSGKRISDERLRAVPWTRFTKEVEEAVENASERMREAGYSRR